MTAPLYHLSHLPRSDTTAEQPLASLCPPARSNRGQQSTTSEQNIQPRIFPSPQDTLHTSANPRARPTPRPESSGPACHRRRPQDRRKPHLKRALKKAWLPPTPTPPFPSSPRVSLFFRLGVKVPGGKVLAGFWGWGVPSVPSSREGVSKLRLATTGCFFFFVFFLLLWVFFLRLCATIERVSDKWRKRGDQRLAYHSLTPPNTALGALAG